jgi:hypothetical protein
MYIVRVIANRGKCAKRNCKSPGLTSTWLRLHTMPRQWTLGLLAVCMLPSRAFANVTVSTVAHLYAPLSFTSFGQSAAFHSRFGRALGDDPPAKERYRKGGFAGTRKISPRARSPDPAREAGARRVARTRESGQLHATRSQGGGQSRPKTI